MKRSSKSIGGLVIVYALCLAAGGVAAADLWKYGELLKTALFLNLGLQVLVVIRLAEAERSRRMLENQKEDGKAKKQVHKTIRRKGIG